LSDELIAEALIGDEAKKFVESELGQVVIGMAKQEVELALEQLAIVDPEDTNKIRELQGKAKLNRMFNDYLAQLITEGENALQAYIQQKGAE
jgi:hypothetical protein